MDSGSSLKLKQLQDLKEKLNQVVCDIHKHQLSQSMGIEFNENYQELEFEKDKLEEEIGTIKEEIRIERFFVKDDSLPKEKVD